MAAPMGGSPIICACLQPLAMSVYPLAAGAAVRLAGTYPDAARGTAARATSPTAFSWSLLTGGSPSWSRGQGRRPSPCDRPRPAAAAAAARPRRPPRPPAPGARGGLGAGLDLLTWLERHIFAASESSGRPSRRSWCPRSIARWRRSAPPPSSPTAPSGPTARTPRSGRRRRTASRADHRRGDDGPTELRPRDARAGSGSTELARRGRPVRTLGWRRGGSPGVCVHPPVRGQLQRGAAARVRAPRAANGAIWQTHLSEDDAGDGRSATSSPMPRTTSMSTTARGAGSPERAGARHPSLGPGAGAARGESARRIAHCPVSNLFISSGVMPLARLSGRRRVGGSGLRRGGWPELSILTQMRTASTRERPSRRDPGPAPCADAHGAAPARHHRRGPGAGARWPSSGRLERGRDADLIAVDPRPTLPPGGEDSDDPSELLSLLIFRERPGMVRGAWVRGRLLPI